MEVLVFLICVAMIAVYIYAAIEFANIAEDKGYREKRTTVIALCILLPLAGYLIVCAMPDRKVRPVEQNDTFGSFTLGELPDL